MAVVELAERRQDGLVVRLMWHPDANRTVLRYRDVVTRDRFAVEVPPDRALDAFHHPNAYRPRAAKP